MFHTFADVKTAEDLKLPVPALAARDGDGLRQPNMLTVEPSPELREYIQDIGQRVDRIQQSSWTPRKTTCSKSPQTAAKPPWT
jgi:hypothetical protein